MPDELAIINRVIEEHATIKGHVKLVGDSVTDHEALASLEKARADWIPGRPEILSEKQKKLQQTISSLEEGLGNHFALEERSLPPLLGELLMQSLVLEHRKIKKEIDVVKSMAAGIKLEGLSRDELLAKESQMQQMVDKLRQLVEEHATREEIILDMIQSALAEKG
jgi:hypothetical protein